MKFMRTSFNVKMLFGRISLNDNPVSGPVGCPSSLSFCADIFARSIKAAVSSIKIPAVGLLKCCHEKKNLRFVNKKLS